MTSRGSGDILSRVTRLFWLGVGLFIFWSAYLVVSLIWGKLDLLAVVVVACEYIVAVGICTQQWTRRRRT